MWRPGACSSRSFRSRSWTTRRAARARRRPNRFWARTRPVWRKPGIIRVFGRPVAGGARASADEQSNRRGDGAQGHADAHLAEGGWDGGRDRRVPEERGGFVRWGGGGEECRGGGGGGAGEGA